MQAAGFHALFVGGCVRNGLLGLPTDDIDIATDARPDRVMQIAEAAGLKAVPTGIDHGTVTVVADGLAHEVTTFRRDVETDGRRAVIAFADKVEEDAARRDFTMNALYADAGGHVIDPLGQGQRICAPGGCASSATRMTASARITCASCAFSASTPITPTPRRPRRRWPCRLRRDGGWHRPAVARTHRA